MNAARVKAIIKGGEGIAVEFKECKTALNKNVYETVCSFLNHHGGELLLGKNPRIARVFKEIGKADELGSGTRNLYKYCKTYCGHDPLLLEEDVFRFTLSLTPQVTPQAERDNKILAFCSTPKTREEIQDFIEIKDRQYFRTEILQPLLREKRLALTFPETPNNPLQKYYTVRRRSKK